MRAQADDIRLADAGQQLPPVTIVEQKGRDGIIENFRLAIYELMHCAKRSDTQRRSTGAALRRI
jgi:hypothetical protein